VFGIVMVSALQQHFGCIDNFLINNDVCLLLFDDQAPL